MLIPPLVIILLRRVSNFTQRAVAPSGGIPFYGELWLVGGFLAQSGAFLSFSPPQTSKKMVCGGDLLTIYLFFSAAIAKKNGLRRRSPHHVSIFFRHNCQKRWFASEIPSPCLYFFPPQSPKKIDCVGRSRRSYPFFSATIAQKDTLRRRSPHHVSAFFRHNHLKR
jgi:hypothetical protein